VGIDHTAIVVADTDRSLSCYRDTPSLRAVGGSENSGPEQERLNNCEIHRVLKRGGRLAVAVWASLDRAPA
jgi:catechol 2,3-dioxygenase-like lactoylglutathione lyase family enzyme